MTVPQPHFVSIQPFRRQGGKALLTGTQPTASTLSTQSTAFTASARGARRLITLLLSGLVLCEGCARLRSLNPFGGGGEEMPLEVRVHALAIAPDVDYAAPIELGQGRRLFQSERDLLYADGDHFYPIVVRGFPRVVGKSPSGNAVAFLEPTEFETAADLYVFDVPARTLRRLTNHFDTGSTVSVKRAKWLDDQTIFYIEGFRYGTVSQGGDLWVADVRTLACVPLIVVTDAHKGEYQEIIDFEFVPGQKMIRYVVAFYDEHGHETRKSYYSTLDGKPVP
jgi:hypothetical protein